MAAIDYSVLAQQYGLVYQLVNSVPEIRRIFDRAVAQEWSSERFQAALQGTNWWRSNSQGQRQYLVKSLMDPATVTQDMDNAKSKVRAMMAKMGYTSVDDRYLENAAFNMLYSGWDESRLRYEIGMETAKGNFYGMMDAGEAGEFSQQMKQLAYQNGIQLDEHWFTSYYSGILKGTTTVEQAARDIRNQAAAKFGAFADQILAGQNVMDIASPYIQGMSNILEINAGGIDLFDPTITEALNSRDSNGNIGVKPLWQFENDLRRDRRWLSTKNAQDSLMGVAHQVGKDMGVLY